MIEHVQRVLHWHHDAAPEARIEALEQALRTSRLPLEEVIPLFAALLSLPHPAHYPPLNLPPNGSGRRRTTPWSHGCWQRRNSSPSWWCGKICTGLTRLRWSF